MQRLFSVRSFIVLSALVSLVLGAFALSVSAKTGFSASYATAEFDVATGSEHGIGYVVPASCESGSSSCVNYATAFSYCGTGASTPSGKRSAFFDFTVPGYIAGSSAHLVTLDYKGDNQSQYIPTGSYDQYYIFPYTPGEFWIEPDSLYVWHHYQCATATYFWQLEGIQAGLGWANFPQSFNIGGTPYQCRDNTWAIGSGHDTGSIHCTSNAPPSAPTGLTGSCTSSGINLSWSPTPGAIYYDLRVDNTENPFNCVTPSHSVNGSGDVCTGATYPYTTFTSVSQPGKSFTWWVYAYNSFGLSSYTSGNNFSCPTAPSAPTGLTGSCNSSGVVNLSWTADPQATKYDVRVNNIANNFPCTTFSSTPDAQGDVCTGPNVTGTSLTFNGTLGTTYDWWMYTWSSAGYGPYTVGTRFTCNLPVSAASCSAAPNPQFVNTSATWTATPTGPVDSYTCSWSGDVTGSGCSKSVTYSSVGTKNATVTITGSDGSSASGSCSLQVRTRPQCSDGLDNDGDGVVDEDDPGCRTNPSDPSTYDPNLDSETKPLSLDIDATPKLVNDGDSSQIVWSSTNAVSCTVTENNPNITDSWTGTSGTQNTSPIGQTTVYTITCTGADGQTATDTVTVRLNPTVHEE
jgi:hypothetical protein